LLSDSLYVDIYVAFTICIVRVANVAFSQKIVSTSTRYFSEEVNNNQPQVDKAF